MSRGKALHRIGAADRANKISAQKQSATRPNGVPIKPDYGLRQSLASLRGLGVTSLGPRLAVLAFWSFVSGISQAGVLVILSDVAVNNAQGKSRFNILSLSISSSEALLIALGLVLVFFTAGVLAANASSSMSAYALRRGRDAIINGFFGASWAVQAEERLGQVQQMLTVNAERLSLIVLGLAVGLQALLNILALLLAAFVVSPISAAGVLGAGIVLFLALRPFNTWTRRAAKQMSSDNRRMATMTTEYTRLIREFRLLGVENEATTLLHNANEDAAKSLRRTRRLSQTLPTVYSTVALIFVLAGLALLVKRGAGNLASIGAVLLLILRSLAYGAQVQGTSQQLREYGAFVDELRTQVDEYNRDSHELRDIEPPPTFEIRSECLSFAYDRKTLVLNDISFKVEDGSIVGIIGRSGSGKTTLAQIILGMRKPSAGEIHLGGIQPSQLSLQEGASPIALVAQDPVLLQGSIAFNVAFFRDLTVPQIESACRAAHLHDDILAMPRGYDTAVGEGGNALSGGQRQRLAIARALAGGPRLLVLDEPTSALDGRSERLIRQTLDELRGRMTVVVISHRLVTVDICDQLLVLDRGHLVDSGPSEAVRRGTAFQMVTETVSHEPGLAGG